MKTIGIIILIPIVFTIEAILVIGSLTMYLMCKDKFLTEQLIEKL